MNKEKERMCRKIAKYIIHRMERKIRGRIVKSEICE